MRSPGQFPPLSRIVLGDADPSRAVPPWIIATAISLHLMTATLAWWPGIAPRDPSPQQTPSVLQLDRLIDIEMPKLPPLVPPPPEPAPKIDEVPPPPPPPKVEKAKPAPRPAKRMAPPAAPKKAVVRKNAPAAPAEPAAAAQVVSRSDDAAGAPSFDVVTGKGEAYAGGVTSSSGKSKTAVREIVVKYQQVLLRWIERHKRYPRSALRRRLEGRPFLEIRIDRRGRLFDVKVTNTSNHAELDEAAIQMVRRAEPLPPVPEDHAEDTFVFRFAVDFNVGRD